MYCIRLFVMAIITAVFMQSASQAVTKEIRARYPSQQLVEAVTAGGGDPSVTSLVDVLAGGTSRRNWRRVGKIQRATAGVDNEDLPSQENWAADRLDYRDPIAKYTSGSMRRTRVISPRYKSIFARSKSLTGSEFIPNNMDPYTGKLATRRRQTFMWHPEQMNDLFVLN